MTGRTGGTHRSKTKSEVESAPITPVADLKECEQRLTYILDYSKRLLSGKTVNLHDLYEIAVAADLRIRGFVGREDRSEGTVEDRSCINSI